MTVVCYKDGVMAADSNVVYGNLIIGSAQKVLKTDDGFLVGGSGNLANLAMFFDWFQNEDEGKPSLDELKLEDIDVITVDPDGNVFIIDSSGWPMEIKADYYVSGTGSQIAMGAMAQGATAIQAVELACKFVPGCGGDIQVVKLKE